MVTSSRLARIFGVSKSTINRLARENRIPHVQLPSGHRRFDPEEVLRKLMADADMELEKRMNTKLNAQ